jgi:DNA-binding transcriptional LysR family regulator
MKITLDELQTFATVVDTGSITAAAQQLEQTVSAASRTLGRLEEKLKTTLLRRTTRRLELTEEGRTFLQNRWWRGGTSRLGGCGSTPRRRSCCT